MEISFNIKIYIYIFGIIITLVQNHGFYGFKKVNLVKFSIIIKNGQFWYNQKIK